MDLVCTKCNDTLELNEFLGTLNHPFCQDCWDETWKGREEDFIFSILHKVDKIESINENEKFLTTP